MVEVAGAADIVARARAIVSEQLGVDAERVTEDAILMGEEHLGADSLDMVELAMAVEEEFDIEVNDDELEQIKTFGDAVRLIEQQFEA
jgi:acyl carrier protein